MDNSHPWNVSLYIKSAGSPSSWVFGDELISHCSRCEGVKWSLIARYYWGRRQLSDRIRSDTFCSKENRINEHLCWVEKQGFCRITPFCHLTTWAGPRMARSTLHVKIFFILFLCFYVSLYKVEMLLLLCLQFFLSSTSSTVGPGGQSTFAQKSLVGCFFFDRISLYLFDKGRMLPKKVSPREGFPSHQVSK